MAKIEDYIVKTNAVEWTPLVEKNVNTQGIYVKALRRTETGRAPSIILKFEAGASYPYHNHPSGEELMVLDGSCFVNDVKLEKGDYLYTPVNAKHAVRTDTGCTVLFIIPSEVEVIEEVKR